jgi:TonB family protein
MKENNKNRNNYLSDLIRYTRGEMTKREENTFQRKLQKDPFAAEAAEGFSEISPSEAAEDVEFLGRQIKGRTRQSRRKIIYRIAASVAVLMVVSSIYLYIDRNKSSRQLSQQTIKPAVAEQKNEVTPSAAPIASEAKELQTTPEKKEETAIVNENLAVAVPVISENPADKVKSNAEVMPAVKDTIIYVAENKIAEPQIKADSQPQALTGAVTAGYADAKSSRAAAVVMNKTENAINAYIPPQPLNGQESFDNYISGNIQKPSDLVNGQSATVVVSFIVRSSGTIDSINVMTSPGKEYSDESIRLIKEGPSWKPAERNNEKVDDKVRVRIVFK